MTLPVVPGSSMSFSQINTELGLSSTATISLNDAAVRTLAGVGASPAAIAITNLSGKSNEFAFTISSNQTNANLRTLAVNAGWNQSAKAVATINSGVYCSANSTGTPGLTISGSFPGGVSLINNGFIIGMGGAGGQGRLQSPCTGIAGSTGGLALSVSSAVTITNNGTIGGGGGGGGGGGYGSYFGDTGQAGACGSGGGGGRTGTTNSSKGGRQTSSFLGLDGNDGTLSAAGASADNGAGGFGAAGGTWGASGGTGGTGSSTPPYSYGCVGGAGGGAGAAITGNSNITYLVTGTRLGAIS